MQPEEQKSGSTQYETLVWVYEWPKSSDTDTPVAPALTDVDVALSLVAELAGQVCVSPPPPPHVRCKYIGPGSVLSVNLLTAHLRPHFRTSSPWSKRISWSSGFWRATRCSPRWPEPMGMGVVRGAGRGWGGVRVGVVGMALHMHPLK